MIKPTVHALAFLLVAAPLLLVGCGGGSGKGSGGLEAGGGSTDGTRPDGGGSAIGAKLDASASDRTPPEADSAPASPAVDTAEAIDVAAPSDTTLLMDSAIPDAPVVLDLPLVIDTASIDVTSPLDVAVHGDAQVDVTILADATGLLDTTAASVADEILWSCNDAGKLQCFDYGGRNNQLSVADQQTACTTNGGVWSASPCSTTNRVATCLMYGSQNPNSGIVTWWRWFAGAQSLSAAQQVCTLSGSTWIPG